MTGTSYAVLGLIDLAGGEATPYDLKQALEVTIANFWPVQHTTFYGEPARLAKAGYLTEDQESGGRRRKRYRLTAAGRKALRDWVAEPQFSPPQLRDEQTLRIFLGADPEPLLAARAEWHREKLAELGGYLELAQANPDPARSGVARSIEVGVDYHRAEIESCERLLDSYRRSK